MSENSHFKEHFVLAVSLLILCFFGGYKMAENHFREHTEMVTDTLIVECWDTVRIIEPTEIVRYVTRHDTIKLFDNLEPLKPTIIDDSTVVIPIESITYKDSTENAQYTAYISGFRAALDSININCKNTETIITRTEIEKARRIGFGIQVGVGATRQGLSPYVGVGVQYKLW